MMINAIFVNRDRNINAKIAESISINNSYKLVATIYSGLSLQTYYIVRAHRSHRRGKREKRQHSVLFAEGESASSLLARKGVHNALGALTPKASSSCLSLIVHIVIPGVCYRTGLKSTSVRKSIHIWICSAVSVWSAALGLGVILNSMKYPL